VAGKLRFIHDGFSEIGRKFRRRKLRKHQRALEGQRQEAFLRLGRRSWEAQIDLSAYSDLRDKLRGLDDRAGQLTAKTGELQAQSGSLQSERAAEIARFDELSRPVLEEKAEVDKALRAARARQSENERAIAGLQGRLKWLTDELERPGQAGSGQRSRESLLAEQKGTTHQLAAAIPAREALAAEVNRLTGESQRLADHLARIEADRKSILAPIDAKLQRVQQESKGATREISDVGREQTDRFTELGAALYRQKEAHPALQDCRQAVEAIDQNRAEVQAALDASVTLTIAMPRRTMLKFAAVPLLLLLVAVGAVLVLYSLSPETPDAGPLQRITRRITGRAGRDLSDPAVASEESRKTEIVTAFLRAPREESTRQQAIDILENDLTTVGSTADRGYVPYLTKILRRGEPELRAAAGHSIGMIGPAPSELPVLLEALNDPVPGVRDAALAALQQLGDDSNIRLLVRRIHASTRESGRQSRERFRADVMPDFRRLGVPIFDGATFLHYASDPQIGRAAFVTDAPVQKVLDFYRSRSGRRALQAQEFSRVYFGGTPQDPTGGKRLAAESEASFQRAVRAGKPPAEIRAEMDRHAARMLSLPMARYIDTEIYGSPSFIALEDARPAAASRTIRYVAVFEDRALGKTGFEVHGAAAD